ncbi:ankyrin repeat-containing domain protein [Nemania sp. FL0916]|nr:ankyrin repeat-containing domain protein [Nemania sp. FL0916]
MYYVVNSDGSESDSSSTNSSDYVNIHTPYDVEIVQTPRDGSTTSSNSPNIDTPSSSKKDMAKKDQNESANRSSCNIDTPDDSDPDTVQADEDDSIVKSRYNTPDIAGSSSRSIIESNPGNDLIDPCPSYSECHSDAGSCNSDAILADRHESNDELMRRPKSYEVDHYFDWTHHIRYLWSGTSTMTINTLPYLCDKQVIPLFTHDGNDYQMHIKNTKFQAIAAHRAPHADPRWEDPLPNGCVRSLAWVSDNNEMELITKPLTVAHLGKLFIHKNGHLVWTGYELFVSAAMEVWMISDIKEPGVRPRRHVVDSGLFAPPQDASSESEHGMVEKVTRPRLVRFVPSLQNLRNATPEWIRRQAKQAQITTGSFYLLDLSATEAWKGLEACRLDYIARGHGDFERYGVSLESEHFCVDARSLAGSQLLRLACHYFGKTVIRLVFNKSIKQERSGESLLHILAAASSSSAPKTLLAKLVDASGSIDVYAEGCDMSDSNLVCLLKDAIKFGWHNLSMFLLDKIEFNSAHHDGRTPFIQAVSMGDIDLIQHVFETGRVDVNAVSRKGNTPFWWAMVLHKTTIGHTSRIGNYLLDTGDVDINLSNEYGTTALHSAVCAKDLQIVRRILRMPGVDVKKRVIYGKTPLALAKERGCREIAELLEKAVCHGLDSVGSYPEAV